jgi:hypothetical protein
MFNVVAEIKGTELPNEYVVLSAHLDSWHGHRRNDNGTGTLTMLEAMRILKAAYPNPRRTITATGAVKSRAPSARRHSPKTTRRHGRTPGGVQSDNGNGVEILEGQGFSKPVTTCRVGGAVARRDD